VAWVARHEGKAWTPATSNPCGVVPFGTIRGCGVWVEADEGGLRSVMLQATGQASDQAALMADLLIRRVKQGRDETLSH
jgi:hypothetical protein